MRAEEKRRRGRRSMLVEESWCCLELAVVLLIQLTVDAGVQASKCMAMASLDGTDWVLGQTPWGGSPLGYASCRHAHAQHLSFTTKIAC